ncbi:MAG TPA: hypothetical protein VJ486_00475 [Geothrix sp.]|nr:hypothetical protein [Geothrix sp.]
MRNHLRYLLIAPLLLASLCACRSDRPEDRVRKAFEACRAAVEAGDAAQAAKPLDTTFRGPEGMDKAAARLYLMALLREQKVGVTVLRNEVAIQGDEILQDVDLMLTGRSGGLLPQDASRRSFRLRWRKVEGDYRLMEMEAI